MQYLKRMADDFERTMCNMIAAAVEERKKSDTDDLLYEECLQQIQFCQDKANAVGREDLLEVLREYSSLLNSSLCLLPFLIYKKRLLLRCIHHFKSDLINKMDHMRISGTEPSSVILTQIK